MEPLDRRRRELEQQRDVADGARHFLCSPENVPPEIQRRVDALMERKRTLCPIERELRESLNADLSYSLVVLVAGLERELETKRARSANKGIQFNAEVARIQQVKGEIEANTAKLKEVRDELAPIDDELDRLIARMLVEE